MTTSLSWQEIALRLALTVLAGALIGLNRGEHGRPAGLRTTLLVCLAASLSMIQANLLLATAGRRSDSFVMLDLMRLPLGILSGMGFIGGGVILKRDNLVLGITTASTLWFVTVLGLCFGGGQLALGSTALGIGIIVLWVLKRVETSIPRDRQGTLVLTMRADGQPEDEVRRMIIASRYHVIASGIVYDRVGNSRELTCELGWRASATDSQEPAFLKLLEQLSEVTKLTWNPQGLRIGKVE
jgi:putative Mg2+ transporter-C (MgtC) family protein